MRVAGAPITFGVCEVPGWGRQLPPEEVLPAMRQIGLTATELGPDGFLPADARRLRRMLESHGLRLVAGFLPVVLHRRDMIDQQMAVARDRAELLAGAGADVLVIAADTGFAGYETSVRLSDREWAALVGSIRRIAEMADGLGLVAALHPHQGTVIEGPDSVYRFLEESDAPLCLDTGHVVVGGGDPAEVCARAGTRICHVHLKDVDVGVAARMRAERSSYRDAVASGLYRPLGDGGIDIAGIVRTLEGQGYRGWYVIEQDVVLDGTHGADPMEDAARSLRFLKALEDSSPHGVDAAGPSGPADGHARR